MILAHYCMLFLVAFSLCFACFCLQLYSCYCSIALFCATLTYGRGEGGLGQCYIILGGSEVLLYSYMGKGVSKNQHFLCYIICGRPLIHSEMLPRKSRNE